MCDIVSVLCGSLSLSGGKCLNHFSSKVDLFTAGHGDEPILIDRSPPLAGQVLDGDKIQRDLKYQSSDNRICAQWVNFYDSESGIDRYCQNDCKQFNSYIKMTFDTVQMWS